MSNYPKYYSDVCKNKQSDYVDCEGYEIKYGDSFNYQIQKKFSRGNYSEVFEGQDLRTNQKVIIKVLKPVKINKIRREIKILKILGGKCNTIKLLDVVRYPNSKAPSLIFEHVNNSCEQDFRAFYASLGEKDIRFYMLEILKALDYLNSMGIMHRDIKPHNFVIDHDKRCLKLIDFGQAEFYIPDEVYNVRVASRYFKAPELLLQNPTYHYSVDIWALGCLFAGILFMKEPFFAGQDSSEQLLKIAKVVGSDELTAYASKYNLDLDEKIELGSYSTKALQLFINDSNRARISDDTLNLLEKMLHVDHNERITAKDAMNHPYFKIRHSSALRSKDRKQKHTSKSSSLSKGMRVCEPKQTFNYRKPSPQARLGSRDHHTTKVKSIKNKENIQHPPPSQLYHGGQKNYVKPVKYDAANYRMSDTEIPDSNINVVVRIRPILQKELQTDDFSIVRTNDKNEVFIIDPKDHVIRQNRDSTLGESRAFGQPRQSLKGNKNTSSSSPRKEYERCYSFDSVFDNESNNMQIYLKATKQLTRVVLNGYNATIFAYGVTGAGKTHTMIGYENEPGLMYYTINEIFDGMRALNQSNKDTEDTFQVDVSFLEIYNEQIRDLIVPQQTGLELREDPRNGILIQGLSVFEVRDQNQIFQLLAKGNANRTQESTMTNQTSSRSHAVLMITYHNNNVDMNSYSEVKSGKLSLIDLAGSERASRTGNTGLRMKEGANINKSLLALGNCINVLYENSRTGQSNHVPFRDSKLTRILKESLTGNSKTLMIANISPSGHNYEDTLNTLKYANRTKNLKTKMKRNVTVPVNDASVIEKQSQHINALQGEIESLRAELAISKQQLGGNTLPATSSAKRLDDDDLFLDMKQQISDQFNEEGYKHTQLKNLYIEYENLLFFQKRLKIDIFIQGNKQQTNNEQNIQKIQMLQDQLISISAQEPNLLQRVDGIRTELKRLLRQRARLREYMYKQFKLIKRGEKSQKADDEQSHQDPQQGQTLTNTQAEILETLFHSQEQIMRNNTMKMKEQRLNIKMAKKEYMISCMAEQVGLREFTNFVNTPDRRNFLSKQQIDEILQDSDAPSENRIIQQMHSGASLPADLYCHSSTKKGLRSRYSLQHSSFNNDQLGRFSCAHASSPLKQKSFRNKIKLKPKTRAGGSFDLQPDGAFKPKNKLNTTRNRQRTKFSKTMNPQKSPPKDEMNANIMSTDENKAGIQLYQPSMKKRPAKIQICEIFDLSLGQHTRSKSARSQTQEEQARQQECLDKIQQQNMEMFYQKHPNDNERVTTKISFISQELKKEGSEALINSGVECQIANDQLDKKTNSSYVQFMKSQGIQRLTISSKNKAVSRQKYASPSSTQGNDSRLGHLKGFQGKTYTFGGEGTSKSRTRQPELSLASQQASGLPPSTNMHYYKTQTNLKSRKPSNDSQHSNFSEKTPTTPNQAQPLAASYAGSDSAASPTNRRHLYKALRNSQKKYKKINREQSSNQGSVLHDLQSAVDDANQQLGEFEDCKTCFIAPKPAEKNKHMHTQSYQPTSTGITGVNTLFNTGVKEQEMCAYSSGEREKSQSSNRKSCGGSANGSTGAHKILHKRGNTDLSTNFSQGNSGILQRHSISKNPQFSFTMGGVTKPQKQQRKALKPKTVRSQARTQK